MEDQRKPDGEERSLWSLSPDEQRLLLITFVGGLASIVAGVVAVGIAIAVARRTESLHSRLNLAITSAVVIASAVVGQIARLRAKRAPTRSRRWDLALSWTSTALLWTLIGALTLFVLIWVGVAAGVK